jgi:hypothetical protein
VNSFTLTTHKGTTETIDTTSNTKYTETGTPVAPTGVATGQDVLVVLDPGDATPTAVHVTVILDRVSGKVLKVSGTSITLAGPKDSTRDAVISSGTKYFSGTTTATGVTVGEFVTAFGTKDTSTPTALDALFVDIYPTWVHPGKGPLVTPTLPNPVGPGQGNNGGWPHVPVTPPALPAAPSKVWGTSPPTPVAGGLGRGGPSFPGIGNANGVTGRGNGGGGFSGGGNGSPGHGGLG